MKVVLITAIEGLRVQEKNDQDIRRQIGWTAEKQNFEVSADLKVRAKQN